MSPARQLVGKVRTHSQLGKVTVNKVHEGSRVFVDVTVIDRGKGWNKERQAYTGHTNSVGWMRGENREFGNKDTVHIKTLS